MSAEHILRVPRSDSEGDFVLVNVSSNGDHPLDLKILATEGESPYITTIRQSRISKLRDKRSQLDNEQWMAILQSTLLQEREIQSKNSIEKLETIATIAGDTLAIHFRNNISGITQKLGEILLKKDDDQEIDSVTWAGNAVLRSCKLEAEVQNLTAKYHDQGKTIDKLNKQLSDLTSAKKAHEDALLEKFRELLNAKKLKIRDQQRLLKGAKVDPKATRNLNSTRNPSESRTPAASRTGKRKSKGAAVASESSEEDSFEPKAPTQQKESEGSEQANTPEASDRDATEDDESDDDLGSAPRPAVLTDKGKAGEVDAPSDEEMEVDSPPKARVLPFGKSDTRGEVEKAAEQVKEDKSTLNQEAGNEDEETDDDDDEL